jgi:hypothetical protein
MRRLLMFAVVLCVCGAVFAENPNSAVTDGLTSVISERQGNTFTWIITNNTGFGDADAGWDVLIWSISPDGLPKPVETWAPEGWEWVSGGQGRFEISDKNRKYETTPAIAPGGTAVFQYTVAANVGDLPNPTFTVHVGAVLPDPVVSGDTVRWVGTTVDGRPSWFDRPTTVHRSGSPAPEPTGFLASLLWCGGFVAFAKRVRQRRIR